MYRGALSGAFVNISVYFNNPRTYKEGGEWSWIPPPNKVFQSFFLEDKTSAPEVFSSCSFIPCVDFWTNLVMVSCYGYEK